MTTFRLDAPREAVRDAILDPRPWASGVTDVLDVVVLEPGDGAGVGRVLEASVRAPLGYRLAAELRVVDVAPDRVTLTSTGDLVGEGIWELDDDGAATAVRFVWDVEARVGWMALLEPVARPVFVRSHHVVMRRACRAAARHVGATLEGFRSEEVGVSAPARG